METGKTSKYLKYAIGEIVLVMIGILLALQVNTWNTNRELKKEELNVMKSLHQEFFENLNRFDPVYKFHLNRKKTIETLMLSKLTELSLDSLKNLNRVVGNNYTFDPFQGIYNSIINSGKIELISNDTLKIKISKFQDLLNDYKEEETSTMVFVQNNLYPYELDDLKMSFNIAHQIKESTAQEKAELKQSLIKLMQSDKFENLMVFVYGHMTDIFTEGPILREEMVSIINVLESEIETHN